ncbi:hypothetical protein RF11_13249 [Thelohanellus kitauei]|uniref:Uncharacterized protein n=1 Tax=Thelohanellus kitauei TaxID=669202 RepID=A0A0C2JHY7_THEKT|nr:hypothetical protein RF11_13249 [Thelohanellus kitauei]
MTTLKTALKDTTLCKSNRNKILADIQNLENQLEELNKTMGINKHQFHFNKDILNSLEKILNESGKNIDILSQDFPRHHGISIMAVQEALEEHKFKYIRAFNERKFRINILKNYIYLIKETRKNIQKTKQELQRLELFLETAKKCN